MDLAFELHDLVLTLDRTAERLLTPHGLSYNRYVALVVIAASCPMRCASPKPPRAASSARCSQRA